MIRRFHPLLSAALLASVPALSRAAEDLGQWGYHAEVTVQSAAAGMLTGFPVPVRLDSTHADVFRFSKPGGADLRFVAPNGARLAHEVGHWDSAGRSAVVWVRLDTVPGAGSRAIRMHWGRAEAADSSDAASVFRTADGYRGAWHLGADLFDATANANHGINVGTTVAPGVLGHGRHFDGKSFITLGEAPTMVTSTASSFTVEAWVNWTSMEVAPSTERYRTVINHGTSGSTGDQVFLYARNPTTNGQVAPYYSFGYYTGSSQNAATNDARIENIASDAGQWVHLAGVYDGTNWRLYRNGVLMSTMARTGSIQNSPSLWYIGAYGGAERFFLGALDELRFSGVARSADWIRLAYETQRPGSAAVTIGPFVTSLKEGGRESGARFSAALSRGNLVLTLPPSMRGADLVVLDAAGRAVRRASVASGVATLTLAAPAAPGAYVARLSARDASGAARVFHARFAVSP